ncbi:MAG: hypothetical protein M3680_13230 [Myxococcota bacterium]|nr:hypothetical protein [Myxococcota bacterium]
MRPLTYGDGLGAGVAALAIAAAWYLAVASLRLGAMYADFGDVALPAITRVVLHPAWLYGVPIALVSAFVVLHLRRPRHGLVGLALAAITIDLVWYWAAWAPIHALAGKLDG